MYQFSIHKLKKMLENRFTRSTLSFSVEEKKNPFNPSAKARVNLVAKSMTTRWRRVDTWIPLAFQLVLE
jgi:hypothetical protein